ncbi:Unknown protein sequence [Pseudomonas syringae pv. maculicola]|nr:Unknown protein sequence [Pseudomonas syringae pv. maculicola]
MLQAGEGILLQGLEGSLLQSTASSRLLRMILRQINHSSDSEPSRSW